MNIDSILDNIKYSIASSNNNGQIEITDNSFLLNLLKEESTTKKDKKPFKVPKPWKCFNGCRFPITNFIFRMIMFVVAIFIWFLYAVARALRYVLFGKKHDKELSLSPRFNFVLFIGFVISYFVIVLYLFLFFLKSVLLFNPDSSVNEHGAIVIPQPCSIEHYVYLFNAAECWANTGIKVLEGDEVKIAASGSFYSSISQMKNSAAANDTLQYSRVIIASAGNSGGESRKLLMYHKDDARFGSLLLQIKEDSQEPSFDSNNNGINEYRNIIQLKYNPDDSKGFETIKVQSPGLLCFAVNDIYFTDSVINKLKRDIIRQKKLEIDSIRYEKNDASVSIDLIDIHRFEENNMRGMWFYDNVGEILLSITVTRNIISERESTPSCIVKLYRWIEAKVMPLSGLEILGFFLLFIMIIGIWLGFDYYIGLMLKECIESKK